MCVIKEIVLATPGFPETWRSRISRPSLGLSEWIRYRPRCWLFLELTPGVTMNRRYVVAATFLGITACVTSAPESPETVAKAGNSVTQSNSTAAVDELHVVDVPEVPEAPEVPILARNENPNDRVCRYEQETGSHLRTRVCRTRAEIEATRLETQKALRDMSTRGDKAFRPPYD